MHAVGALHLSEHLCAPAWDTCCAWVLKFPGDCLGFAAQVWQPPSSSARGLWQLWNPTFQPGLQVLLAAVALGEGLQKCQVMVKAGSPRAALSAVVVN